MTKKTTRTSVLTQLESSNLDKVRYHPELKKLRVYFKNGSIYDYTPVSQELHDGLITADSAGSFFFKNIRINTDLTVSKIN